MISTSLFYFTPFLPLHASTLLSGHCISVVNRCQCRTLSGTFCAVCEYLSNPASCLPHDTSHTFYVLPDCCKASSSRQRIRQARLSDLKLRQAQVVLANHACSSLLLQTLPNRSHLRTATLAHHGDGSEEDLVRVDVHLQYQRC